eukprot:scaffold9.g3036.t1
MPDSLPSWGTLKKKGLWSKLRRYSNALLALFLLVTAAGWLLTHSHHKQLHSELDSVGEHLSRAQHQLREKDAHISHRAEEAEELRRRLERLQGEMSNTHEAHMSVQSRLETDMQAAKTNAERLQHRVDDLAHQLEATISSLSRCEAEKQVLQSQLGGAGAAAAVPLPQQQGGNANVQAQGQANPVVSPIVTRQVPGQLAEHAEVHPGDAQQQAAQAVAAVAAQQAAAAQASAAAQQQAAQAAAAAQQGQAAQTAAAAAQQGQAAQAAAAHAAGEVAGHRRPHRLSMLEQHLGGGHHEEGAAAADAHPHHPEPHDPHGNHHGDPHDHEHNAVQN